MHSRFVGRVRAEEMPLLQMHDTPCCTRSEPSNVARMLCGNQGDTKWIMRINMRTSSAFERMFRSHHHYEVQQRVRTSHYRICFTYAIT